MKKNIVLGLSIFVAVLFVLYANIKANEANRYKLISETNLELAKENEAKAKAEEEKAIEMAAKVRIAEMKAVELKKKLDNCRR